MSPRRTCPARASRSAASTAVFAPTWVRSTTAASPTQVSIGIRSTVVPPRMKWLNPSQCVKPCPGIATRLDRNGCEGSSKSETTVTSVFQRTCGRIGSDRSTIVTLGLPSPTAEMPRHLGRRQARDRVAGRDLPGNEDARVHAAPSRVPLLGHARVRAVEERRPDVEAGAGEAGDLHEYLRRRGGRRRPAGRAPSRAPRASGSRRACPARPDGPRPGGPRSARSRRGRARGPARRGARAFRWRVSLDAQRASRGRGARGASARRPARR